MLFLLGIGLVGCAGQIKPSPRTTRFAIAPSIETTSEFLDLIEVDDLVDRVVNAEKSVFQDKIAHSREISKDEEEKSKGDKGASLLVIILDFVVLVLVLEIFLSAFELRNIWPNNCFGPIALHNRGRGRLRWACSPQSRPPPETQ